MYPTLFLPYSGLFFDYIESHKKYTMTVQQYHDTYEIYLQTKGERYIFLENICHAMKPGDVCIIRPFDLHYGESRTSDYYGRYVLNFPEEKLDLLLTQGERQLLFQRFHSCILHLTGEVWERTLTILQGLSACWDQSGFLAEKLQYSYVFQLLMLLKDRMPEQEEPAISGVSSDVRPEILQAIHYLNEHYRDPIDLDTIADTVHMSKYHFCRLFSKATGATFVEYLNNVRLTKVHQMLLETALSLSQIAEQTGFSSPGHLSRVFGSVYQMSPSKFRKQKHDIS